MSDDTNANYSAKPSTADQATPSSAGAAAGSGGPQSPAPAGSSNPFDEKAAAQAASAPPSTKSGEQIVERIDDDDDAATADHLAGEGEDFAVGPEQLKAMIAALQTELDKKSAEASDKHDQFLRAVAETENVRRRLEREKDETARYAISKFAKDILSIGDNFQRAITAVSPEAAANDPALKTLLDGVVLAEREYRTALERHGVSQIDPTGQPFNPHHHQAVMEHDDPNVPSGTVIKVFMTGYMLEDRCLRPAMVVVSRGGAKASKSPDAQPNQPSPPDQTQDPIDPAGTPEN